MSLPEAMSHQTLRIVDANLNRIGEGLRLLEDLARLALNDANLNQQLKNLRHEILRGDWPFHEQLLQSRNSEGDVGMNIEAAGDRKQRELPVIAMANARRVQESLRTLEELAKLPGSTLPLDSEKFKQARFNLYTIEQALLSKLQRQDKMKRIAGLYAIIDTQALKGGSHIEAASKVIKGGASIIQLRDKVQSKGDLLPIAQELRNLCAEHNVLFIINDYFDLALATGADGLHLGQEDLPIKVARRLLAIDKILGCSTTTTDQAIAAESDGADYIAVGSMYPTTSKETAKIVGLERLRQVRQAVNLPLVAIGGINKDNAAEVMAAGANSVEGFFGNTTFYELKVSLAISAIDLKEGKEVLLEQGRLVDSLKAAIAFPGLFPPVHIRDHDFVSSTLYCELPLESLEQTNDSLVVVDIPAKLPTKRPHSIIEVISRADEIRSAAIKRKLLSKANRIFCLEVLKGFRWDSYQQIPQLIAIARKNMSQLIDSSRLNNTSF